MLHIRASRPHNPKLEFDQDGGLEPLFIDLRHDITKRLGVK